MDHLNPHAYWERQMQTDPSHVMGTVHWMSNHTVARTKKDKKKDAMILFLLKPSQIWDWHLFSSQILFIIASYIYAHHLSSWDTLTFKSW